MLHLLFQLGGERYAIAARQVRRVLPLVRLRPLPQMPPGIAGLLDHGGTPVPALDLGLLVLGRPAEQRMSTRIILVEYGDQGGERLLGLIAERAGETAQLQPQDFAPSGVRSAAAPYLGDLARSQQGLVQKIELERLLPPAVRAALWVEAAAT